MDITPHVNLLRQYRAERISYPHLIGEAIDNAFDAGANSVAVTIADKHISFKDDGCGITKDRIVSLFSIGDHGAMNTTQLGRFGIGIKAQALNAGDVLEVVSISRDGKVRQIVNWRDVLKGGRWIVDDPRWLPVTVGAPTGTTITISELRKPPKFGIDEIRDKIAAWFYPAIANGQRITLNGLPVPLMPEPTLTEVVDRHLMLSGGRSAHLRAGIISGPSKLHGVNVSFKHRVIKEKSPLGCEGYSGLNKMFGRLQIAGPWHLSRFKDDLTDETELEELQDAVAEAMRPILEKCNSAAISARIFALSKLINDLIPEEFAPSRPKKNEKEPVMASGKRARASGMIASEKAEDGGPARAKRPRQASLVITFDGNAEQDGIGAHQSTGKMHRVNLSKDDPTISKFMEYRDQEIGAKALTALAIMLFEEGVQSKIAEPEFDFQSFGWRVSRHMNSQNEQQAVVAVS